MKTPSFTPEQIETVLASLGIDWTREGNELKALCPAHEERTGHPDHNPSWSINANTGVFFCFSCHYAGNLFTLVSYVKGEEAAKTFRREVDIFGRIPDGDMGKVRRKLRKSQAVTRPKVKEEKGLPATGMSRMFDDPPEDALTRRMVSADACAVYGVRWETDTRSWILPIRHLNRRNLLGWQVKSEYSRAFHNHPWHMQKAAGLFMPVEMVLGSRIAVVESPLDAVRLYTHGCPAVAVCGSKLSEAQVLYLAMFRKVLIALDNDGPGVLESLRLKRYLPTRGVHGVFLHYESHWGKDIGEMPEVTVAAISRRFMGSRVDR